MKTYTISDFLHKDEITKLEKFIDSLEKNKELYQKVIIFLALIMKSKSVIYAENTTLNSSLEDGAGQIIDLLMVLAKYSFLGLGLKEMITQAIGGASFKESASSACQYLLTYLLLRMYPSLFNMFAKINF